MNINIVFLIVQIGFIPSIVSLTKYYFGERSYKLLYIYIITSYLTEVVTNRLINSNHTQSSITLAKAYMLFEFIILISLLKRISKSNNYIKALTIFGVVFWLIENVFLLNLNESEKYFNVISSIILFLITIYSLTTNLNKNYRTFFKEADFAITITILFNFSFRIVFEYLYYNYEYNLEIIQSISDIYLLVNFITNILFIYCLTCIKNTKKLISSF